MADLLDVVDDLTLPRTERVESAEGWTWVREDALLVQLQDAIASTTGRAGGRSLGHERMILDGDALLRFHRITSAIGDWCRMEGVRARRDPVRDLRAWFVARMRRPLSERLHADAFYERQLQEWADLIRAKFSDRRSLEWLAPCPECGAVEYEGDDGPTPHPVVVSYHPDRPLQSVRWECRACGTAAEGEFAARYLAFEAEKEITRV